MAESAIASIIFPVKNEGVLLIQENNIRRSHLHFLEKHITQIACKILSGMHKDMPAA